MLLPTLSFNDQTQRFENMNHEDTSSLVAQMDKPLSLTFQLTRNCNLRCVYCSEPPGIASLKFELMKDMIDKLAGMRRIIFSGGEPMQYYHFWDILEYSQGKFEKIVLSTNACLIGRNESARLKDLVDYIDVTVDGPRYQHNIIRGQYDAVIRGLMNISLEQIPLSVVCVYLPNNKDAVHYIVHTGDMLNAIKVKILTPIPKGRSVDLFQDFVTGKEIDKLAEYLEMEKIKNGWHTRIIISDWLRIGKGHAILVEPDGRMVASSVWHTDDCIEAFANLSKETANQAWMKFQYKENHLNKYLERSMVVV